MSTEVIEESPGAEDVIDQVADSGVSDELTWADQERASLRIWLAVIGILSVIAGALILTRPAETGEGVAVVATVILGMYAVVVGIAYAFSGLFTSGVSGWSKLLRVAVGLLAVLAGILIVANVHTSAVFFVWFVVVMIGLTWITEGVLTFLDLGQSMSKVWSVAFAIVSIMAGLAVLLAPLAGAAILWMVVGLAAVVWGVLEVVAAFIGNR